MSPVVKEIPRDEVESDYSDDDMPPVDMWEAGISEKQACFAQPNIVDILHTAAFDSAPQVHSELLAHAAQQGCLLLSLSEEPRPASAPAVLELVKKVGKDVKDSKKNEPLQVRRWAPPGVVSMAAQLRSADYRDDVPSARKLLEEQLMSQPDVHAILARVAVWKEGVEAQAEPQRACEASPKALSEGSVAVADAVDAAPEKPPSPEPVRKAPRRDNRPKLPQPPALPNNAQALGVAQRAVLQHLVQSPINQLLSQQPFPKAYPQHVNQPYGGSPLFAAPQEPSVMSLLTRTADAAAAAVPGFNGVAGPGAAQTMGAYNVNMAHLNGHTLPLDNGVGGFNGYGLGGANVLGLVGFPPYMNVPAMGGQGPYAVAPQVPAAAAPAAEAKGQPAQRGNRPPRMEVTRRRPCAHNQWERISKKKNSISLRCRTCKACWKTKLEFFEKCTAFYAGHCEDGDSCPHPHIYSKAAEKHQMLRRQQEEEGGDEPRDAADEAEEGEEPEAEVELAS
eukprot:TRINITY_DN2235_c0_g3_i1.p1 TRINITY_DN2235_c0_g3~~TRINITY_DN2235_c0_g3_i1.p1  ORF type:complete len:506 (+),score=153.63 TRINITY_DN2235_c0_g3_i1:63-1580(+)